MSLCYAIRWFKYKLIILSIKDVDLQNCYRQSIIKCVKFACKFQLSQFIEPVFLSAPILKLYKMFINKINYHILKYNFRNCTCICVAKYENEFYLSKKVRFLYSGGIFKSPSEFCQGDSAK